MTVEELLKILESHKGKRLEVRIASQPHYPMEYEIKDVVSNIEMGIEVNEENEVLYIVEGEQLGYSSKKLWNT